MLDGALGFLFIGFLFFCGLLLEEALVVFFHFQKNLRTKVLGSLFAFIMLSWFSGAVILFWQLTVMAIAGIVTLTAAISAFLYFLARRKALLHQFVETKKIESPELSKSKHWFIIVGYLVLAGAGFYLLAISRTGAAITTPWQTINRYFIYVFTLATFVLALSITARLKTNWIILLMVVHSLLLHSYLPLTHDLFYGADGWRHLANESNILSGFNPIEPTISDKTSVSGLTSSIGKMAYSQLWGISILIAKISGLDLMTLNKWLLPILWSLFIPVILFEIGRSFGWSKRRSLFFVWLSFLPFASQAGGSFTLPVNLGFITWLALILLVFKRAENPKPIQVWILFAAGLLSMFGYSLFVILFWLSFLIIELFNRKKYFSWPALILITLLVAMVLPFFEWKIGFTGLTPVSSFFSGLKQFIGNFIAYYLAAGPRPHDISIGNIILNQTPAASFVMNYFTAWRWWLVVFMIIFWMFVFLGLRAAYAGGLRNSSNPTDKLKNNHQRIQYDWLLIFTGGIFLSYVWTRYWLPGEHLLTRRLDVVLAFLFITLFTIGISKISVSQFRKPLIVAGFLILSITIAASYSLGPDTKTVSVDEYAAMKYVWSEEKNEQKHCVIADVYPLLALEALSQNKVIGGGFPISHNFEQPELTKILTEQRDIDIIDLRTGLNLTGAKRCWILAPSGKIISSKITLDPNAAPTFFGGEKLWNFHN